MGATTKLIHTLDEIDTVNDGYSSTITMVAHTDRATSNNIEASGGGMRYSEDTISFTKRKNPLKAKMVAKLTQLKALKDFINDLMIKKEAYDWKCM